MQGSREELIAFASLREIVAFPRTPVCAISSRRPRLEKAGFSTDLSYCLAAKWQFTKIIMENQNSGH